MLRWVIPTLGVAIGCGPAGASGVPIVPGAPGSDPTTASSRPSLALPLELPPPEPAAPFTGTLTWVPGSTAKVDTLIGDVDRETGEPTLSLTETRYAIAGTDLGYSFEHDGRAWFLFGDTLGPTWGDTLATTTATDGDGGVRLDFLTGDDGRYLRIRPDGVSMAGFEVPVSGLSLDGVPYVVVSTNHVVGEHEDVTVLTRFDEETGAFTRLRDIARLPEGHFRNLSMKLQPGPIGGLPSGGPWVLMWGTGKHRESDAWLQIVPAANLESGAGTLYWTGDVLRWSPDEADAVPVVAHPTMGDLSVTWVADLGVWLMVYDSRDPRGVAMRWSATPWGPWTELQTVFDDREAIGVFIHQFGHDDGLAGPMIGEHADPMYEFGGGYAPYVVERFTRVEGDRLIFYYTLSTWNPYLVVLLRSELAIGWPEDPRTD